MKKLKYFDIMKRLDGSIFDPVVVIIGEEPYLAEVITRRYAEKILPPDMKQYNYDILYCAKKTKAVTVLDAISMLPMFCDRRLTVLRRFHLMDRSERNRIYGYLENPCPSTTLLILAEKLPPGEVKVLGRIRGGVTVNIYSPYESDLPRWINGEFARNRKRCTRPACSLLIQLAGNDLGTLMNEVGKLVCYSGSRDLIEEEDVRKVVSGSRSHTVFEAGELLAKRDLPKYFTVLHGLLESGTADVYILNMIYRHFMLLYRIMLLDRRRLTVSEICSRTRVNRYHFGNYRDQVRFWKSDDYPGIFDAIYHADRALKTGIGKPHLVLSQLGLTICRAESQEGVGK